MLCIPKNINKQLKILVQTDRIDTDKFLKMTSQQREDFLETYLNENGKKIPESYKKEINRLIVNKFKTEISEEQYKLISDTYKQLDDIKVKENVDFLDTPQKIKNFVSLSKDAQNTFIQNQSKKNLNWTRKYVEMGDKLQKMIDPDASLSWWKSLKTITKQEIMKVADARGFTGKLGQGLSSGFNILTSPLLKSIKASVDMSYQLRQGFKVLTQSPSQWQKSTAEAFNIWTKIRSKDKMQAAMNEFKANVMADPFYDMLVNKGKTAIGVVEDIFPETVAQRFPILGNIFKASDEAFTVFSQSARYGIAKELAIKQMKSLGRELTTNELKSIGFIANSMTGRGSLGRLEASSGIINRLLFSGRFIRSNIDTFIMPFNPTLTKFAQKEALTHSLTTLGSIATLMAGAKMMGFEVEVDPRSSKFGRVKVGANWIDLTAGIGGYVSLFIKQGTKEYKDTKGKIIKLNDPNVFKGQTRTSVLSDWATNKLSPGPGMIKQVVGEGELFGGVKPTPGNITKELVVPITVNNWYNYLTKEDLATALLLGVSDSLGLNVTSPK